MSRNFVIPIQKVYSYKYDFLIDNKINEIEASYNDVTKKEEKKEYEIDIVGETYENDKHIVDLKFNRANDVHWEKYFVSGDTNDGSFMSYCYRIHISEDIKYDFESISYTYKIVTANKNNEITSTKDFEKDQELQYNDYNSFMYSYKGFSEEWWSKVNYTTKENEDKSIDVYLTLPHHISDKDDNINIYINYKIKIKGYNYTNEAKTNHIGESENNERRLYSINTSILGGNIVLNNDTLNEKIAIQNYLSNSIMQKYKTRKRTIEIEMPLQKLYNKYGSLVYDIDIGETPDIDDVFTCEDKNKLSDYSKINTIKFKVLKVEFKYNGVPKLIIKGKEI